jgi:DNA-binding GntR family transcriptional regulator
MPKGTAAGDMEAPGYERPLYRKVVEALKRDLLEGRYPIGSRLPTESELCARFDVSRHTVRDALRHLRADGLIASRQGAGTTVLQPGTPALYVHKIASVEELTQYAKDTRYAVDGCERVIADAVLAARLGCPTGQGWLRVRGFRYRPASEDPICWTEVFIHEDYSGVERLLSRATGAIYTLIEDRYGERIAKVEQVLRACPIPSVLAAALRVEAEATGIEVRRNYSLADGKLVEVAFNLHPADRFSYSMVLHRDPS